MILEKDYLLLRQLQHGNLKVFHVKALLLLLLLIIFFLQEVMAVQKFD